MPCDFPPIKEIVKNHLKMIAEKIHGTDFHEDLPVY